MKTHHPYNPAPTHAGQWIYYYSELNSGKLVTVTENPTSGRRCDELRMGGCAQTGYSDWSGLWLPRDAVRINANSLR